MMENLYGSFWVGWCRFDASSPAAPIAVQGMHKLGIDHALRQLGLVPQAQLTSNKLQVTGYRVQVTGYKLQPGLVPQV